MHLVLCVRYLLSRTSDIVLDLQLIYLVIGKVQTFSNTKILFMPVIGETVYVNVKVLMFHQVTIVTDKHVKQIGHLQGVTFSLLFCQAF